MHSIVSRRHLVSEDSSCLEVVSSLHDRHRRGFFVSCCLPVAVALADATAGLFEFEADVVSSRQISCMNRSIVVAHCSCNSSITLGDKSVCSSLKGRLQFLRHQLRERQKAASGRKRVRTACVPAAADEEVTSCVASYNFRGSTL